MSNDLKLFKVGKLYLDQINNSKMVLSASSKIVLSLITNLSDSRYAQENNNGAVNLSLKTLSEYSFNLFSASAIKYHLNKLKNTNQFNLVDLNYPFLFKSELNELKNGIKVNSLKKEKFICILKTNNENLNKPSLILLLSFLLDRACFHFKKEGYFYINNSELDLITKQLGLTPKTIKNDIATLFKNNLIEFKNNQILITEKLAKEYCFIFNFKFAEKENLKSQKEVITKSYIEHVVDDLTKVSNSERSTTEKESLFEQIISYSAYRLGKVITESESRKLMQTVITSFKNGKVKQLLYPQPKNNLWEIFNPPVENFLTQSPTTVGNFYTPTHV